MTSDSVASRGPFHELGPTEIPSLPYTHDYTWTSGKMMLEKCADAEACGGGGGGSEGGPLNDLNHFLPKTNRETHENGEILFSYPESLTAGTASVGKRNSFFRF